MSITQFLPLNQKMWYFIPEKHFLDWNAIQMIFDNRIFYQLANVIAKKKIRKLLINKQEIKINDHIITWMRNTIETYTHTHTHTHTHSDSCFMQRDVLFFSLNHELGNFLW